MFRSPIVLYKMRDVSVLVIADPVESKVISAPNELADNSIPISFIDRIGCVPVIKCDMSIADSGLDFSKIRRVAESNPCPSAQS